MATRRINWGYLDLDGTTLTALDFVGLFWIVLDFIGFYWILLDFIGFRWIPLDSVGSHPVWPLRSSMELRGNWPRDRSE
jgi:hypothetical protein